MTPWGMRRLIFAPKKRNRGFSTIVNDDGPPSRRLSPYVQPLVNALQKAGHLVSVAIPAASRSWIGKAHLIEASLKATYVPPAAFRNDGTWDETFTTPPVSQERKSEPEWVIITNGTPASCVQLGLFNLFTDRPPIDLVISGPNHGRNASTIYNLSSGTVGGALEAATCKKRGIAVSFGSKDEQPMDIIEAAARLAVRIIHHLYESWDERVELYNLNIPMLLDVESRPVLYTRTLPYYWSRGYLYAEISGDKAPPVLTNGTHGPQNGQTVSNGNGVTSGVAKGAANGVATANGTKGSPHFRERDFKWSAELTDMKKALQASEEGTDAHTVLNGSTSVTPLCANFWYVPGLEGPLHLS
ncbi:survival protein sure-like phosphatase/nucleotidase [Aspergillus cavernicola]|uniref:Survival protein sure-like phosphatase/nucleotidase n=1 Tax=Aspergillus cavernicola TaxID=176166 RepID=A0ABR4IIZ8_9EURO